MQVKLKTRMAGPDGNHAPGETVTIDDETGKLLIAKGSATLVEKKKDEPVKEEEIKKEEPVKKGRPRGPKSK